jgi:hypothetical protein
MGSSPGPNPAATDAGAATGAGAAPAPASSLPIALKVGFTLNTPDGLRQISFGLEEDADGVKVNWTIAFTLFERTDNTKPFGDPIVSLNVFVATTLHANAAVAAHKGLTPAQTAHATGPAADAARAANAGTMPLPVAQNIIQSCLR